MKKNDFTKLKMDLTENNGSTVSPTPKITELQKLKVGDEVILCDDTGLGQKDSVVKGQKYRVTIVDPEFQMIALEGIERMYKSDNFEYEIGWEFWRFCLPKDYIPAT